MLRQMRVDVPRDTIMVMGGRIVWRFYKVPRQAVHKNQLTGPCSCHKVPRQAVIKISSRDPCGGNISFYDTEILALGSDRSLLCLECLFSRNLAVPLLPFSQTSLFNTRHFSKLPLLLPLCT